MKYFCVLLLFYFVYNFSIKTDFIVWSGDYSSSCNERVVKVKSDSCTRYDAIKGQLVSDSTMYKWILNRTHATEYVYNDFDCESLKSSESFEFGKCIEPRRSGFHKTKIELGTLPQIPNGVKFNFYLSFECNETKLESITVLNPNYCGNEFGSYRKYQCFGNVPYKVSYTGNSCTNTTGREILNTKCQHTFFGGNSISC
jgi:hypothetical protein